MHEALETGNAEEIARRLVTNHFLPKTWYTVGLDFVSGDVSSLGGTKLTLANTDDRKNLYFATVV